MDTTAVAQNVDLLACPADGDLVQSNLDLIGKTWLDVLQDGADEPLDASSSVDPADASALGVSKRTFHAYEEERYLLPNDGTEQNRLDLQHRLFGVVMDDQLSLAPVKTLARVLDIGTGTGKWALEFARKHPTSQVYGTDLSLIQPSDHGISNCQFIQEDSEEQWSFDQPFDYIHLRAVVTCFHSTPDVIKGAFEHLNEGGWIEFQDISGRSSAVTAGEFHGTSLHKLSVLFRQGFSKIGRDIDKPSKYKQWLVEAGFVDVVEKRIPLPLNPWPAHPKFKLLGQYGQADVRSSIGAVTTKVLPLAGLSPSEAKDIASRAQEDLGNPQIRAYSTVYIVYGRKPVANEAFS